MASSTPKTDFPPIQACIFDLDGLLLNTEDIYTVVTNTLLASYNRPPLPWSIKAQLQGRPFPDASRILNDWAQLPVSPEEYAASQAALQRQQFPSATPLPGVEDLLHTLAFRTEPKIELALATSSHTKNYELKTGHLPGLFAPAEVEVGEGRGGGGRKGGIFKEKQKVMGDDPRVGTGRGKPAPDIFLVALETINEARKERGEREVKRDECLVFEDSVPGVEAGRRAGMRVVWVPHEGLRGEYEGREGEVLAGRAGMGQDGLGGEVGVVGDGWGEERRSLVGFDYERYGIKVVDGKGKE